ncbi:MAG: hypothetical protein QOK12_4387, partial [Mycobacterium sp.]|nr:hypothetical protein [Mycobacterium sp.]
ASVTNLIERLVAKGFLRREPDPLDRRRALLDADLSELIEHDVFASWQLTGTQSWERYSDIELAVILDFLADTAQRLRSRTEALAAGRVRGPTGDNGDHD